MAQARRIGHITDAITLEYGYSNTELGMDDPNTDDSSSDVDELAYQEAMLEAAIRASLEDKASSSSDPNASDDESSVDVSAYEKAMLEAAIKASLEDKVSSSKGNSSEPSSSNKESSSKS